MSTTSRHKREIIRDPAAKIGLGPGCTAAASLVYILSCRRASPGWQVVEEFSAQREWKVRRPRSCLAPVCTYENEVSEYLPVPARLAESLKASRLRPELVLRERLFGG